MSSSVSIEELFLSGYSILIVEDSGFQAAEIDDIVTYAGANVVGPARDLEQARRLLDTKPVDAAVLDINLDGQVIFPFARELSSDGMPFLFLSGSITHPLMDTEFRETPCVDKPVRERMLLETLRTILL